MNKDSIQETVLKILEPLDRASVALSMGTGKTLLGLKHMNERYNYNIKFLVVIPKLSIALSWDDEIIKHKLEYLQGNISYCTYRSLSKKDLNKYDIIYLDEVHNLLYSHQAALQKFKGDILGLTGTPPKRANSEKGIMINRFCPVVYSYDTDSAISDNLLNDYRINIHTLNLSEEKTIKINDRFFTSELASYNYWCARIKSANSPKEVQICRIMRMKVLKDFESKERFALRLFNSIPDKCLLFANTQEQADKLCKHSYHSKNLKSDYNLNLFKSGSILKLSAVEQLNEGINIPNLKHGIVLHAYGNERKFTQKLGRFLRLNPNEQATIHILCYKNTVDEEWVKSALEKLDQTKITWK